MSRQSHPLQFNGTLDRYEIRAEIPVRYPAALRYSRQPLTQDHIIAFVTSLPGVVSVAASEASGASEVVWGDSFFFYDPDGDIPANRRMPLRH